MSSFRTCGYCSYPGHNRRTCETLKQRLRESLSEWNRSIDKLQGSTNPRELARMLANIRNANYTLGKMTGINPVTGEAVAQRRHTIRKCSYCKTEGHDRRTCTTLKKDQELYREATRMARNSVIQRIMDLNIGIYTLYTKKVGYYDNDRSWQFGIRPFIIIASQANAYTYSSTSFRFVGVPPKDMMSGTLEASSTVSLSELELIIKKQGSDSLVTGASQCTPAGSLCLPSEWLAAENIDFSRTNHFKKGSFRSNIFIEISTDISRRYSSPILRQAAENIGYYM